ncbi:hypothetical protein [Bradyrhizobium diazoefficiens]|uniref:hypothetical protein n=1 Tax=Bradyrhizobium diazoefficiens TaxID=1355477 RepID=UPI0004B8B072|nr:hypothetical protein [Bradyrhizobium diazoefficiens]
MKDYVVILLQRLQTGWRPRGDEIDMRTRQRRMSTWRFDVDLLSYPDDTEVSGWARAEKLIGRANDGRMTWTGEILWIDAELRWALCEDGFWWLDGS